MFVNTSGERLDEEIQHVLFVRQVSRINNPQTFSLGCFKSHPSIQRELKWSQIQHLCDAESCVDRHFIDLWARIVAKFANSPKWNGLRAVYPVVGCWIPIPPLTCSQTQTSPKVYMYTPNRPSWRQTLDLIFCGVTPASFGFPSGTSDLRLSISSARRLADIKPPK